MLESHRSRLAHASRVGFSASLLTGCLSLALIYCLHTPPVYAQGRGANTDIAAEQSHRNLEIQRVIERSNAYFQSAEISFKDGNFDRARREYDRAVDTVLEAGIDVRTDARLQQHYQNLVERIFQRQMTLMAGPRGPAVSDVAQNGDNSQQSGAANKAQDRPSSDRGFGQQVFEPSPLDELTKLSLTDEETKGATEDQAQQAVAAAKLDFKFRPNALIQSFINYYLGRGRETMEQGLRRSGRFLEMAQKIFKEEGVPQDVAWLGQVESAWSPVARSGYADFWEIYARGLIPQETRNYVPNILAVILIAKNPEKYGFSVKPEPSLKYDYVKVYNMVDLRLASDATDTPYEMLLALNPEL